MDIEIVHWIEQDVRESNPDLSGRALDRLIAEELELAGLFDYRALAALEWVQ